MSRRILLRSVMGRLRMPLGHHHLSPVPASPRTTTVVTTGREVTRFLSTTQPIVDPPPSPLSSTSPLPLHAEPQEARRSQTTPLRPAANADVVEISNVEISNVDKISEIVDVTPENPLMMLITDPLDPSPALPRAPTKPISASVRALLPALAAQPAHYVTVHIFDRPYLVTAGDSVRLPFLMRNVRPGDVLRLNRASVLGSRDYTLKGRPYIDDRLFECRATVLGVESEPMRIKIKKKQRNRRMKKVQSKHRFTILRISELKICKLPEEGESSGD